MNERRGRTDKNQNRTSCQQKQVVRIYIQDKTRSMAEPVEEFVLTETVVKQIKIRN